jgi:hypothetical protein
VRNSISARTASTRPRSRKPSASYDPDPGDSLVYSWNLKVQNNGQPVALAELIRGNYAATLEVQDPHGATSVARTSFYVRDLDARPDVCYSPPRLPKELQPKSFGQRVSDANKFLPIDTFDYSQSGQSIVVSGHARGAERRANRDEMLNTLVPPPRTIGDRRDACLDD